MRKHMISFVKDFAKNEDGAVALEYALVMVLVAFGLVAALTTFSGDLNGLFTGIGANIAAYKVPAL